MGKEKDLKTLKVFNKMKENIASHQKVVFFLSIMLMFIALALGVSAAPSISLITTTIQQNTLVNISITDAANVTALSVYAYSSATANSSSGVLLVNITNTTATPLSNGSYANFTFGNNLVLEDNNAYSIAFKTTASGGGAADGVTGTTATGVTMDRTAPSAPTLVLPSSTNSTIESSLITFSGTVIGADTTGCTLIFSITNPGSTQYAMTHSGDSCTQAFTSVPDSSYSFKIRASDGTNTSDSAIQSVTVSARKTSSGQKVYAIIAAGGGSALGINAQTDANGNLVVSSNNQPANNAGGALPDAIQKPFNDIINHDYPSETSTSELKKTGIGVVGGAALGFGIGMIGGPLAFVTGPIGAIIGGFIGFYS